MGGELEKLKKEIFYGEHSHEEWLKIYEKVNKSYSEADLDEKREFDESGAGDMLGMLIEYAD